MKVRINTVDGDRYVAHMDRANADQLVRAFHEGEPVLTVIVEHSTGKGRREVVATHINRDAVVSVAVPCPGS